MASSNISTSIIDNVTAADHGPGNALAIECERLDPPTYDEAIDPASAPPPSYDSLFGRVREARKSSKGLLDFAKNVLILLLGTRKPPILSHPDAHSTLFANPLPRLPVGCTIILCVTIVIPVCMIVFGMLYMYDCPQGQYIPVYLLVGGEWTTTEQLLS